MNPLQIAAYTFGIVNASACIGMFFVMTKDTRMSLLQRVTFCSMFISAVAYLALRVSLIYQGIH